MVAFIKDLEIRQLPHQKRGYMWALFQCPECSILFERPKCYGKNLQSCYSCFRKSHKKKISKHGDRYTRLYRTWINMRARCNNPKDKHYKYYGSKGITICKEWEDYAKFKEFALNNGYTDTLTIDRIDPNGNYEPLNVQFITNKENAGKDKIRLFKKEYEEIKAIVNTGVLLKTVLKNKNISNSTYYRAKKEYEYVS